MSEPTSSSVPCDNGQEGIIARKGFISIGGEEYIPRRQLDDLRAERDRLAAEVQRLREELANPSARPLQTN